MKRLLIIMSLGMMFMSTANAHEHHRHVVREAPAASVQTDPLGVLLHGVFGIASAPLNVAGDVARVPVRAAHYGYRTSERAVGGLVHATWYGREMCRRGRCRTANGAAFRPEGACVIAHNRLPFGTRVLATGSRGSEVCTVADRGHAWDFSHGAAMRIGIARGVRVMVLR